VSQVRQNRSQPDSVETLAIEFPGLLPSWVGPNPFGQGFTVGTHDGRVALADEKGDLLTEPVQVADSGEPINCVAFAPGFAAVTTRAEISLLSIVDPAAFRYKQFVTFPRGAHDIIPLSHSRFVAAVGQEGLLLIDPANQTVAKVRLNQEEGYAYRMVLVDSPGGTDRFLIAERGLGASLCSLDTGGHLRYQRLRFDKKSADIVDLCVMASRGQRLSAAFLDIDGSVFIARDIPTASTRQLVLIDPRSGAPVRSYSIAFTEAGLCVLTSEFLWFIHAAELDKLIGSGEAPHAEARAQYTCLEAEEMFVIPGRGLALLSDGHVQLLQLGGAPTEVTRGANVQLDWDSLAANATSLSFRDYSAACLAAV
jgi:hypothetical protein